MSCVSSVSFVSSVSCVFRNNGIYGCRDLRSQLSTLEKHDTLKTHNTHETHDTLETYDTLETHDTLEMHDTLETHVTLETYEREIAVCSSLLPRSIIVHNANVIIITPRSIETVQDGVTHAPPARILEIRK